VDCAVVLLALRLVPVPDLRPPSISISDPSFVSLTWTGLPFKLPFQRCFVFVLDILFLRSLIQSPSSLYGNSNDSVVCLPSFFHCTPSSHLASDRQPSKAATSGCITTYDPNDDNLFRPATCQKPDRGQHRTFREVE